MKTIAIAVALLSGCFMQDVSGMYLREADAERQQNAPVEKADGTDALLFEFLDKKDHKNQEAKEAGKEAKKEAGKEAKKDDDADALLFPFLATKGDEMVVAKAARKVDEKELERVNMKSDHKYYRMEDKAYFLESVKKMHDKKDDKKDILKQMAPAAPAPEAIESPAAPAAPALAPEAADKNEDEKIDKTHRTNMIVSNSQVADLHTVTNDFDMKEVVFPADLGMAIYYVNATHQTSLHMDNVDGCVVDAEKFLGNSTSKPVTQQKARELAVSRCKSRAIGKTSAYACKKYEKLIVTAFGPEVKTYAKGYLLPQRLYTALQFCVVVENWKMNNFEDAPDKGSAPAAAKFMIGFAQALAVLLVLLVALAMKFGSFVMPCVVANFPKWLMGSG